MNVDYDEGLDACLTRLLHYGRTMRSRDLTTATERERALDDARRMLGLVALCRQMLDNLEQHEAAPRRLAA